mgnify:CR=1 FL=1
MSDNAHPESTPSSSGHGHSDPMSHVPPPSIWPLVVTIGLFCLPFGIVSMLGGLKTWPILSHPGVGLILLLLGFAIFLVGLMFWCHQIISEKKISHNLTAQQGDLQMFILLFLVGEFMAFGAVFAYVFHRNYYDPSFGPPHIEGFHFGGPMVAMATFLLLSSSITCEFAHHAIEHGKPGLGRLLLVATIILGVVFLGFQGLEWGELIQRGYYPLNIEKGGESAFAACFYTGTGFHGLHVAIGLVMLCMVLLRLETGAFRGKRSFALVAASWYWHFVDIVWVLLFITIYVFS